MKKPLFVILTLSALYASGATSLAWSDTPYLQPPATNIYDTADIETSQSMGVDSSVVATAVTSDTGNGTVVIYSALGGEYSVPFDLGNVHPTNQDLGMSLFVKSQGLSAVAVDPQTHSVYAAGETFNGSDYDCLIKKYDQNGTQIWSITHDFQLNKHDFCHDIAIDGNGDVIVAGTSVVPGSGYVAKMVKLDANGNVLAENSQRPENCGSFTPCQSQIMKISIGSDGRIVALIKREMLYWWIGTWDTNLQKMPGVLNGFNPPEIHAQDVAVDANGNIYAVGWSYVDNNGTAEMRHKLIRFDEAYNITCEDSRVFGSVSVRHDWHDGWFGVTVANDGHAYVTGSDQKNIITMEYDAACTPQWSDSAGAVIPLIYNNGSLEIGYDIAIDANGDLHIAGQGGPSGNTHALTLKYSRL